MVHKKGDLLNIYDLPAEILLANDENFKSQILAFGILEDKTTDSTTNILVFIIIEVNKFHL